jgi:two-component system, NarL family, sensor histidine kinase UhpB
VSLFGRVVSINAGAIIAAALVLALSPVTVSARPQTTEIVVLALGTIVLLGVNVWLVRRAFEPLQRLAALMRKIDPHEPGRRIQLDGAVSEVADVTEAFNAMLDRIEQERMLSGRRALMAQENERKRQLQETARGGVEEVREIARGLRPGALEELGLRSALTTLANSFTGLRVRHSVHTDLPVLSPDQDLAVYRVAQESLTNVARHAQARSAQLELEEEDGAVVLRVSDDGCGIPVMHTTATDGGVGGMRERALLAGGRLRVRALPERGTEVRLDLWPSP